MSALVHSMAPLKINSTVLAISEIGLPQDVLANVHQHSGNEYPTLVCVPGANPMVTFKTPFADAFALIGFTVLSATTLDFFLAKFASLIRSASSVHPKLPLATSATAYVHITGTSVSQDGILMADCEAWYISADQTTHPIGSLTTNNALPTLAAQPTLHTLGPISINGTVYGGLSSTSLNLDQQRVAERTDGGAYASVMVRTGGSPRMTLDHHDPIGLWSVISPTGTSISANVVQYFRKFDSTTGVVGSSNSVSFTIASGRVHPTTLETSQGQVAKTGIEVIGTSTSSTHPVAVSTSATSPAIP